jgi:hypothetical protein
MCHEAFMRQIFVHFTPITPVAIYADIFVGMDHMPFAFFVYRVLLCMASEAGRWLGVLALRLHRQCHNQQEYGRSNH